MEKMDKLKEAIDKTEVINNYKIAKKEITKEKELLEKVKEYQEERKENRKQEIINHPKWKEYKKKETDVNLLILEINQELKKISNKGKCEK